jgi:uncharacterized UBP type Zn finger protein
MFNRLRTLVADLHNAQCCFCGESLAQTEGLSIAVEFPDGASQHMYAHSTCFSRTLHPSIPFMADSA